MNKNNQPKTKRSTLVSLIIMVLSVLIVLVACWDAPEDTSSDSPAVSFGSEEVAGGKHDISLPSRPSRPVSSQEDTDEPSSTEEISSEEPSVEDITSNETSTETSSEAPVSSEEVVSKEETTSEEDHEINVPNDMTCSMTDALFIGDSRTVGIRDYSGLNDPDYFCTVGMSIYNYSSDKVNVSGVGSVSLDELLSKKQYGKVYIMLGINEVGYHIPTTASRYSALVEKIKTAQPNALIFIQASLHVSKNFETSSKNYYDINNKRINELNSELAKLADYDRVFYLDANSIFDDNNGALASSTTGDGVHLYAKYYPLWTDWIVRQTAIILDWLSE